MVLKDQILGANDLRTKTVEVPEWGCSLTVCELGLSEGVKLAKLYSSVSDSGTVSLDAEDIARVVSWGVLDPQTGERMFSEEDVPSLARKSQSALMGLFRAITSISHPSDEDVEEAAKN